MTKQILLYNTPFPFARPTLPCLGNIILFILAHDVLQPAQGIKKIKAMQSNLNMYGWVVFFPKFSYLISDLHNFATHFLSGENEDSEVVCHLLRTPIGLLFFFPFFPFFFFLSFFFSRAAVAAYGGSQARGLIGAIATGLRQSHSNAGSKPLLQPTPQLTATPDT